MVDAHQSLIDTCYSQYLPWVGHAPVALSIQNLLESQRQEEFLFLRKAAYLSNHDFMKHLDAFERHILLIFLY